MTTFPKVPLGSIVKIVRGISYKSSELADGDRGVPMVNLRNVGKGGGFREDGLKYYTGEFKSTQVLNPGDLILANTDLSKAKDVLGSPFLVPASISGAVLSLDLSKLVPDESVIDKRFLNYFLQSPEAREFMKTHGQGITVMHLRMTALPGLQVPVPPLDEQRSIVESLDDHLSRLDKALADLDHAGQQTLVFRRSILNALLNPNASGSEPGVERMSKWRTSTLGEVCDLYQPKTISMKEMKASGEFPVYGANGQIGFYDKFNHEDSQVLLSCRGNCGTVNVSQPKSWINGNAMVCAPKSADLSKDFLAYFLQSVDWKPVITGTAQPQITRQPLAKVALPLPPIDEQLRIVEALDDHLSRLDSTQKSIASQKSWFTTLRRSILNKAFIGELGTN